MQYDGVLKKKPIPKNIYLKKEHLCVYMCLLKCEKNEVDNFVSDVCTRARILSTIQSSVRQQPPSANLFFFFFFVHIL